MINMRKGGFIAAVLLVFYIGTFVFAEYASAGEIAKDYPFIAYDNGTVLDTKTKLMWAATDNGININWANAKSYCNNYRGGGYTDWRMPTQAELAGLYEEITSYDSDCGWAVSLTRLIHLTCMWTWASETRGPDAAYFDFFSGERLWLLQSHESDSRVLPVRSSK